MLSLDLFIFVIGQMLTVPPLHVSSRTARLGTPGLTYQGENSLGVTAEYRPLYSGDTKEFRKRTKKGSKNTESHTRN